MSYITIAELTARHTVDVADLTAEKTTEEKEAYLNSVIEGAQGLIDSYLSERYTTPLATANAIIKEFCYAIVMYKMYQKIYGSEIPERIKSSYKDTISQLKDITAGKMNVANAVKTDDNSESFFLFQSESDPKFTELGSF